MHVVRVFAITLLVLLIGTLDAGLVLHIHSCRTEGCSLGCVSKKGTPSALAVFLSFPFETNPRRVLAPKTTSWPIGPRVHACLRPMQAALPVQGLLSGACAEARSEASEAAAGHVMMCRSLCGVKPTLEEWCPEHVGFFF